MSNRRSESESVLYKPRFGFFSYIPGVNRIATPKKYKQKLQGPHILNVSINKTLLNSSMSYISIGDEYHEAKFELQPEKYKSKGIFQVHNKIFRPPGPFTEPYLPYPFVPTKQYKRRPILSEPYLPYPFVPTKQYKRRPILSDDHKKNIKVPKTKKFFSIFPYINPDTISQPKPKVNFLQKKKFISVIKPGDLFNSSASVYGPSSNLLESCEENSCSDEEIDKCKEILKVKEKCFKPVGRSTSEIFGRYEYKSEIDFPAKRRQPALPKLHKRNFKTSTLEFTKSTPSIDKISMNLFRDYKLLEIV
ncbi:hypothetical protein SteCoe_21138 [Stentor coeruleus]|uniref:Uncharacterized protein n=1 Tax=Stentor coeruleus TaxID=5963 RepID=A0A1R2BQ77_9CILI|nr:hypothetical protein SteCoe_21138 [Stentor coeruleus]